jgi:YidC/Oxa1 family membrane protein insertase
LHGFFAGLVDGMTLLLNWLYGVTGALGIPNYGLAIILLTILVKVILYPLNYKQMHSMLAMQRLQPRLKEIQEKYRKDPQKLQQKVMELYQEHGINPMSGCLPLLIQLPILIALYRSLLNLFSRPGVENLHFLWISNLGHKGITSPTDIILPLLAGATTYWQMKITPQGGGQQEMQRVMTLTMPLFIMWITTTLPAGLGLYWVVYNILTIIQQYMMNRRLFAREKEAVEGEGSR